MVFLYFCEAKSPREDAHQNRKKVCFRHMSLLLRETKSNRLSNHLKINKRVLFSLCVEGGDTPLLKAKQESGEHEGHRPTKLCHFKKADAGFYKGS